MLMLNGYLLNSIVLYLKRSKPLLVVMERQQLK
ncbi:hypothetical protein STW0522CIT26_23190 [Citrobacter portucalensis]|nr:hypothetical protein STW0522CIT26_23190 [Citrobacter portucalensis]BBV45792.1 hypothetical protein STW0522CIT27_22320 [Citrobacter portucalensis]BBV51082.1 hypothetical protein STW0522CIT30_23420 [Citrobacter portucalensis]BBW11845.1 hypothetical protein STN0717CIT27_23210 [Citrobacter portucalensis]BBW16869.1 hypothetical protein STN0717CIT36_22930 [Citrobacter portucalensis]